MTHPDDILAELPAPNAEEPASLRRDIADELRDHLECAARREAVVHHDADDIQRRVLKRFGDPRKVALKLWLDWMKEKLMMQKITLALVSLIAVISLGACGLMWILVQDVRTATVQAHVAIKELLQQNQQMIGQLAQSRNQADEPSLMEWVPARIRIVKQNDKEPAAGFQVSLSGFAYSDGEKASLKEETDKSGMVDFGLVRPGAFQAYVTAPWGQKLRKSVTIKPGEEFETTIVAPAAPPAEYQLRPVIEWTKWLAGRDAAVLLAVAGRIETEIGEDTWSDRDEEYWLVRQDRKIAKYNVAPAQLSDSRGNWTLKFTDDPVVLDTTVNLRHTGGGVRVNRLVRLSTNADFPKNNDTIVCLDEWSEAHASEIQFPRGPEDGVDVYAPPNNLDQIKDVAIKITPHQSATAMARLAADEFSGFPSSEIGEAVIAFAESDTDQDLRITAEQREKWVGSFRERFGEGPISLEDYVPAYIESIREARRRAEQRRANAKKNE